MIDRCRKGVGERETMVNPTRKVVTQPPPPLPTRSDSQKLSFVRNQDSLYPFYRKCHGKFGTFPASLDEFGGLEINASD